MDAARGDTTEQFGAQVRPALTFPAASSQDEGAAPPGPPAMAENGTMRRCCVSAVSGEVIRRLEVESGARWAESLRGSFSSSEMRLATFLKDTTVVYPGSSRVGDAIEEIELTYVQQQPARCLRIAVGVRHNDQVFFFTMPVLDIALSEDLDLRVCKISQGLQLVQEQRECGSRRLESSFLQWLSETVTPVPEIRRRKLHEFLDADRKNVTLPLFRIDGCWRLWQRTYEGRALNSVFEEADGWRLKTASQGAERGRAQDIVDAFNLILSL
ncbi:unnamed protein product [Symbiodinium natans]|uniref:Uncharacterized protein n=1 Tax=Symbiodinium natans TaxID=878477 RepID=A0A812H6E8_9DINO|nr:unnamed protein product [Symbiodinium natans]